MTLSIFFVFNLITEFTHSPDSDNALGHNILDNLKKIWIQIELTKLNMFVKTSIGLNWLGVLGESRLELLNFPFLVQGE